MNYVGFNFFKFWVEFWVFFFFIFHDLNSSRVSPTLSLVKTLAAFDVIRPHLGLFFLLCLLRSDLCKLASNQHRHHYHLALALGLSLLCISLDWPELPDWQISRLVLFRLSHSSFLWSSVPHDSSALAQMTESWQSDWVGAGVVERRSPQPRVK